MCIRDRYGTVHPGQDNLVVIDDSIVRGTTLRRSIIRILDRLKPKKIIICSSAPQIRYPDCYGIDMSRLGDFVAFKAAIALLKERGMNHVIDDVYHRAKIQMGLERDVYKRQQIKRSSLIIRDDRTECFCLRKYYLCSSAPF